MLNDLPANIGIARASWNIDATQIPTVLFDNLESSLTLGAICSGQFLLCEWSLFLNPAHYWLRREGGDPFCLLDGDFKFFRVARGERLNDASDLQNELNFVLPNPCIHWTAQARAVQ